MICKIAGLGVDVPELGDLAQRCQPYLADVPVDIEIPASKMRADVWPTLSAQSNYYLTTGFYFYRRLLLFDGLMLHASAVAYKGHAYLFSGPCGIGKSTHTHLWQEAFGEEAVILNDDKPALRRENGAWQVYGTPWCGKDGLNHNGSAPLVGICFLHRGDPLLRRLTPMEALPQFLRQTNGRANEEQAKQTMNLLNLLLREIPVFEYFNHAEKGDAETTYRAMSETIRKEDNAI